MTVFFKFFCNWLLFSYVRLMQAVFKHIESLIQKWLHTWGRYSTNFIHVLVGEANAIILLEDLTAFLSSLSLCGQESRKEPSLTQALR